MSPAQKSEWFGRFITRYRSSGELSAAAKAPSLAAIEKSLSDGGMLLRHPFIRSAWARCGKQAQLFVNGEAFTMAPASARILASQDNLDRAAFTRLDSAARTALEALLQRGLYQLKRKLKRQLKRQLQRPRKTRR